MLKTAAQTLAKPLPNVANSIIGEVVGTSLPKTIKVRVGRVKIHPLVQKVIKIYIYFLKCQMPNQTHIYLGITIHNTLSITYSLLSYYYIKIL